jgi:hypothetical protein
MRGTRSYTLSSGPTGTGPDYLGEVAVQTAQPRDVGALIFVVGLFLTLLVVTLATSPGPPPI